MSALKYFSVEIHFVVRTGIVGVGVLSAEGNIGVVVEGVVVDTMIA